MKTKTTTAAATKTTTNITTKTNEWTAVEHAEFLKGLQKYGRSWESISKHLVLTRTPDQVKAYASKYFAQQAKDAGNLQPPTITIDNKGKGKIKTKEGHWTDEEHAFFLLCWAKYGKSWQKISQVMKTRSNEQIRTHAQKYFTKLDQLRTCGYEGTYTMDGTRHLTRTFLKKAHVEGRVKKPTWKSHLKVVNPRGVVKRHRNRHGNALARLGGGKHRHNRNNKKKKNKGDDDDDEQETEASTTTYITRSGRVVTWTRVKEEEGVEEEEDEENVNMDTDETESETENHEGGEDVSDEKQEAIAPLPAEDEDEENNPNYHGNIMEVTAYTDDQHDAKQDGGFLEDAAAVATASVFPGPMMLEALQALEDPMMNHYWGQEGLTEGGETHTSLHSLPVITRAASSTNSSVISVSASSSSVDGTTTHAAVDDMMLMMSSADGSLLWETGHNHQEEEEEKEEEDDDDDINSLFRPPSPSGMVTVAWEEDAEFI